MATPTPSTNTPQKHLHNLSSPAPRSVPPLNMLDSPLNMLGEGGVGMGISMSGMGISMSGMGMSSLGLTASQLGRADEDERRRRLETIIAMINKKKGRVSEEGIMALCKQDQVQLERSANADGSIVLTLVIGANAICDITILLDQVTSVKLEVADDDDDVYKTSGSRILRRSLASPPGVRRINTTLDRFALNLDKLLNMERLSEANAGIGCYKAILSIHRSLMKLFEHEKKLALELIGENTPNARHKAEREVLCKKSGRPRMNAGYCLGLSLEYWMDRRHLISKKGPQPTSAQGKEKDDVDSKALEDYPEEADPGNNKIYSLTIECESSPSSMYTPIRIPDSWIADDIEKAPDAPPDADMSSLILNTSQSKIAWLEPKPTYLESPSQAGDHDAMNIDDAPGRLPNIRFVAKFNPPIIVPLTLYVAIIQSVGLTYDQQDLRATTFVGLALRPEETDPGMSVTAGGHTPEVRSTTSVLAVDKEGKETHTKHANTLYIPKLEYARAVESIPFQHPRQLIALLPLFRQYAFITSLVQDVFGAHAPPKQPPHQPPLSPPTTPKRGETPEVQVDLTLAYTHPSPKLAILVPHPLSSCSSPASSADPSALINELLSMHSLTPSHSPLNLVVDIGHNAEISISDQNVVDSEVVGKTSEGADVDMDGLAKLREKVKRLERALDTCGDLGVWAEWLRREAVKEQET
ncbi:hypothetical protein BU23DRAFT_293680 [Bimuria novae-zelandiae CBS 107.79]|uniref:Mediator of RNA polymerase II transcription subunit 1 n=1 Tax=Bimuria novae-zelandiae CBS 107.79 TaxID=1447943 RepID=A0A6A5VJW3_9PLEO|nr:hypothetical protein BU23DRAFT_293680 [Bimuria novae-zelandiae CBS 107.79]